MYVSGDAEKLGPALDKASYSLGSYGLIAMIIGTGMFGMLLNFSQFLCTMHNSALTTTVVGVLKVRECREIAQTFSSQALASISHVQNVQHPQTV